jgi:demethylmenaquinone methyltransferase/2-methoxy-6-polyprenyl-1,4-benzoquinol methylase
MSDLTGSERVDYVRAMFTRIAHRYDLMNRLMTAGQDVGWRREVIRRAEIASGGTILDLGAGTGDLAREALRQVPDCHPVAVDLTMEMMRIGRARNATQNGCIEWVSSDALTVPFPELTFNAVVSGFLLRNVIDIERTLAEQYRTLKPGGRLVALDTTQPSENLFSPLVRFHLRYVIPRMGSWLTGDPEAYRYLPETTRKFLTAERLTVLIQQAGFQDVGFRRLMFGTAAIHWGKKVNHGR